MPISLRLLSWLWLGLACLLALTPVLAAQPVPPVARVTDLTGTLSASDQQALEQRLAALEQAKGSQIAVLLVPTTGDEGIEAYALRVAEAWKLGRKGVDDGALLLVAIQDRTLRIEVGYGLEGAIPDATAKRVIEEIIVPNFRSGRYAAGILAGVDRLVRLVEGEPLPPPPARSAQGAGVDFVENTVPVAMLFIFVVGGILRNIFGRLLGASIAATVSFLGAWLLLGAFFSALVIALIVFLFTVAGGARSGIGPGMGSRSPGGFGGGGFSGGGGGFGGGGASGRW